MRIFSVYKSVLMTFWMLLNMLPMTVSADFKLGGDAYKAGDYKKAAEEFSRVAEKGDHRAMYALGSLYAGGLGVEQSYRQAYFWFHKAAQYGRSDAAYKIGLMYEQGLELKQDLRKALKWYGKSAKSGYALAQIKLARFYLDGLGLKTDPVKAYAWLAVALAQIADTQKHVIEPLHADLPLADKPLSYSSLSKELNDLFMSFDEQQKQTASQFIEKFSAYQ